MNIRFEISGETFFNNGRIILSSMPDVEASVRSAFSSDEVVETTTRNNRGVITSGVTADSLNVALRRCLNSEGFRGETHVEHGVFFEDTKEGFDFMLYDEDYNIANLFNYYQGKVGVLNGNIRILDVYSKIGLSEEEWQDRLHQMESATEPNNDYHCDKTSLTIAGELQFGNWALLYRDLFRLLKAVDNPGVDMYIYVAADDNLSSLLSKQTVSYSQAKRVIEEYNSIIKTPIWLIALGMETTENTDNN